MGRRRRKVVRVVKRKLPEFYLCPRCGKNTVRVKINRKQGRVFVVCGSCNLSDTFKAHHQMEDVDAYCLFVDSYYGVLEEEASVG